MLRPLYDWTIRLAGHRHALWWLAAVSFIESSFFPIPPDILLIPIILAAPTRAFRIAAICTLSSVVGGFLGYAIGHFLQPLAFSIFEFYHIMDRFHAMEAGFAEYGAWIIIVKGMTPIPFKLLTIASGLLNFDLAQFTIASIISRALRFFLVAALLWKFGPPIRDFIERRLTLVTTVFAALLVGGFVAVIYL